MVPLDNAPTLVDKIRELVPIVACIRTLGAPLAMDFWMSDGPPASRNINYVHFLASRLGRGATKIIGLNCELLGIGLLRRALGYLTHDTVSGTPL
jgi:hypothetical protein